LHLLSGRIISKSRNPVSRKIAIVLDRISHSIQYGAFISGIRIQQFHAGINESQ
jgi:hypothetical protein